MSKGRDQDGSLDEKILFKDESYLVNSVVKNAEAAFVVTFSPWSKKFHHHKPGAFSRSFGKSAILDIGLNVIEVITSRNDWYAHKTIDVAITAAREFIGDTTCITYGSSMGGYAAIKFANALGAKLFISLSPQYSMDRQWLEQIGDQRWKIESEYLSQYVTGDSGCQEENFIGLIFYDGKNKHDTNHALAYADIKGAILCPLDFAGHPVGHAINSVFGLKNVLRKSLECITTLDGDSGSDLARLGDEVRQSYLLSPPYIVATSNDSNEVALQYLNVKNGKLPIELISRYFQRSDMDVLGVETGNLIVNNNIYELKKHPRQAQKIIDVLLNCSTKYGVNIENGLVQRCNASGFMEPKLHNGRTTDQRHGNEMFGKAMMEEAPFDAVRAVTNPKSQSQGGWRKLSGRLKKWFVKKWNHVMRYRT